MMAFSAHQQRVIIEQADLALKIGKLEIFLGSETFKTLDQTERDLLWQQRNAMQVYNTILEERIAWWKKIKEYAEDVG